MRLGLILVCLVSPWISAELKGTFKMTSVPNNTLKNGQHSDVQIFDQKLTLEQTENRGLCKNAQFLIEILSVLLPLLNQDIPEKTKTSYVLQILKNLLLSSPEAAQDHEVLYKINDLMLTLEKYHLKDSDVGINGLRQSGNAISVPREVTTKVIFQYEVPHFQNPNCTAQLMKVIQVVHESIMQLANNPICVEDVPLLNNIDDILINPKLYMHLSGLHQNVSSKIYPGSTEKFLTLPEEQNVHPNVPVFEMHFPEKDKFSLEQQTQSHPFVPHYPYNFYPNSNEIKTIDDLPNPYYDSSPNLSPLVNGIFQNKPMPSLYTIGEGSSEYISLDKPTHTPSEVRVETPPPFDGEFDSGLDSLQITKDYIPKDENSFVDTLAQTQLKVAGDGSEEVRFGNILPNAVFDFDLPKKRPKYNLLSSTSLPPKYFDISGGGPKEDAFVQITPHPFELDLPSKYLKPYIEEDLLQPKSSISTSVLDVYGDGSGEVYIGQDQPHPTQKLYTEGHYSSPSSFSPFDVSGDGSGEFSVHQDHPKPIYEFDLPSKHPKSYIEAKLPTASSFPPFDVAGDGSGEIYIGQDLPNHDFENDWPSNHPKSSKQIQLQSASTSSPLDVPKDSSEKLIFGPGLPNLTAEYDLPSQSPTSISEKDFPSPIEFSSSFDVSGTGSGEIPFSQNNQHPTFNFDFPRKRPMFYTELDLPSVSLSLPFDVSGGGSRETLGQGQLNSISNSDLLLKRPKSYIKAELPSVSSSLPFDVSGSGFGEIPFGQDQLISNFQDLPPPSFSLSPFKVTGDDSSNNIQISPNNPDSIYDINYPVNKPIPSRLPSITELPIGNTKSVETAYIPIDQSSNQPQEMYLLGPNKKRPNKYDASPNSLPLINGKPDLYPNLPNQDFTLPVSFNPKEVALLPLDKLNAPIQSMPFKENVIISNPKKSKLTELEIPNKYVIPSDSDSLSHETVLDAKEIFSADSYAFSPWSTLNTNHETAEKPHQLSPDKKVLVLIRYNIGLIEQKVPEIHLNLVLHDKIEKIKALINLHHITVNEYIKILNQYEKLIENIKNLNGNNKILQKLLFSMTNGGKLELNAEKSHVIELTYLVKRPKPLIYQPYYYIKYQLPYELFLMRINSMLVGEPYLHKSPKKLYESLIPLSKVTETSPDLESYGKEDIFKITFNNGTLVGAQLVKSKDVDMYATLDKLREINADFTVNDIYQLIKNLDIQLKESADDGIAYYSKNYNMLNTDEVVYLHNDDHNIHNQLLSIKLKKKPAVAESVSKLTKKNVTSESIGDILKAVNNFRTTYSTFQTTDRNIISPDSDISKELLRSLSLAKRPEADLFSQSSYFNTYNYLSPSEVQVLPEVSVDANLNHYIDAKPMTVSERDNNSASMYSDFVDLNYPQKMDIGNTNRDWNQAQYIEPGPSIQAKLLDATLNAHKYVDSSAPQHLVVSSISQKSDKLSPFNAQDLNLNDIPQKQNSIGTKLIDATINAHSFNPVNAPMDFSVNSAPMSHQSTYNFGNPDAANSQMEQHNTNRGFNVDNYIARPITYTRIDNNPDNVPSNLFNHPHNYVGAHPNSDGLHIVTYSEAYADPINIMKKTKILSDPNIAKSNSERHSGYNNGNKNVLTKSSNAYYKNYYDNMNMAPNHGRVTVNNQNLGSNWGINKFRHLLQYRVPLLYQRNRTLRPHPVVLG